MVFESYQLSYHPSLNATWEISVVPDMPFLWVTLYPPSRVNIDEIPWVLHFVMALLGVTAFGIQLLNLALSSLQAGALPASCCSIWQAAPRKGVKHWSCRPAAVLQRNGHLAGFQPSGRKKVSLMKHLFASGLRRKLWLANSISFFRTHP